MAATRAVRNLDRAVKGVRILGKIVYWLAVLAISLALLIGLVLFFESRDSSQVEEGALLVPAAGDR
jgi:hypothetical protein